MAGRSLDARFGLAFPVVANRQLQGGVLVGDADLEPRSVGVLEGVGDRLLHDAVRGEVEGGRQRPLFACDLECRLETGVIRRFEQRVDPIEAWLRRQRCVRLFAKHTQ